MRLNCLRCSLPRFEEWREEDKTVIGVAASVTVMLVAVGLFSTIYCSTQKEYGLAIFLGVTFFGLAGINLCYLFDRIYKLEHRGERTKLLT